MFGFRSRRWRTAPPADIAPSRPSRLRGFLHATDGATAVEFAAVAVPFLGIVCATVEFAVVYWAQLSLDAALSDASRSIYTGAFQSGNAGKKKTEAELLAALRNALCTKDGKPRPTMFNCQNVKLSVRTAGTFADAATLDPTATDAGGKTIWNPKFSKYTCGSASAIMQVQAAVDFPVFFTLLSLNYKKAPGGGRVLQAANVFRVEPYENTGACA